MNESTDILGGATVFSTLEADTGYSKVEIDEPDQYEMCFISHHGLYGFTRVPFGLCNAAGTFQPTIDSILSTVR